MGIKNNIARSMSWSEPAVFKRRERGYPWIPKWWHAIAFAVVVIFVLIAIFGNRPPDESRWWGLALGLGFAAVSYLIPILDASFSPTVSISRAGIERCDSVLAMQAPIAMLFGWGRTSHKWKFIERICLVEVSIDGKAYNAIELENIAGTTLARIGLGPKSPKLEKLTECLRRNGIELEYEVGDPE